MHQAATATASQQAGTVSPTPSPSEAPAKAPFRLVDDYWQKHLKFNGRTPRTLHELLIARAEHEHQRRLAEIKAMAKKLALLDEHLPALDAHGVKLSYRDISTWDGGKTLRIHPGGFSLTCDKLHEALLAIGFKEVGERRDLGHDQTAKLKHRRSLVVEIDVKRAVA